MIKDKDKVFVGSPQWHAYPQGACSLKTIMSVYDRNEIILAVIDNGSTDRTAEWLEKNKAEFDILIRNDFNNGPTFKDNQLIAEFNKTPCEWYVYHENDALVCSPNPARVLRELQKAQQAKYGDNWVKVIGFEMKIRPTYPLDPLAHWKNKAIASIVADDIVESRARALFMSIAIHRDVWDTLGFFDESTMKGDMDFYGRMSLAKFRMGIAGKVLQFMANDYAYNEGRYMKARWDALKCYQMGTRNHKISIDHSRAGKLYRSSMFEPKSLERWNPMMGDKTYKEHGNDNIEFYKKYCQLDFSDGVPSWLERDNPKYAEWEPKLLGKLEYIGDHETARLVREGKL